MASGGTDAAFDTFQSSEVARWLPVEASVEDVGMNERRALSDTQIAAHEAGHAVVGHLLGEEIAKALPYTGPQSGTVRFVKAVRAEQGAAARIGDI